MENVNADGVIGYCLYIMNKMRRNFINVLWNTCERQSYTIETIRTIDLLKLVLLFSQNLADVEY